MYIFIYFLQNPENLLLCIVCESFLSDKTLTFNALVRSFYLDGFFSSQPFAIYCAITSHFCIYTLYTQYMGTCVCIFSTGTVRQAYQGLANDTANALPLLVKKESGQLAESTKKKEKMKEKDIEKRNRMDGLLLQTEQKRIKKELIQNSDSDVTPDEILKKKSFIKKTYLYNILSFFFSYVL